MRTVTVTNTALLQGLKDAQNQTVWGDYVGRYRPLIVAYAARVGLTPTDAEDVAQEALWTFADGYRDGKYDRARGRLRGWLFGIVKNVLLRLRRAHGRRAEVQPSVATDGGDPMARFPDDDRLGELWEDEWRKAILRQCLAAVRAEVASKTFEAFDRFAVQGKPAAQVARELSMSENAVFLSKHRVLQRMKELQPELERDW